MVYRASATQATQAKPGPANLLSHTIPSRPTALARCSDRHVRTTCSSSVPMLFILYLAKLFASAREAIQSSVNIAYNVSINHSQCPFPCVADTVIRFVPPLLLPTQRRKWKRDSVSTRRKGSAFLFTFPGMGGLNKCR